MRRPADEGRYRRATVRTYRLRPFSRDGNGWITRTGFDRLAGAGPHGGHAVAVTASDRGDDLPRRLEVGAHGADRATARTGGERLHLQRLQLQLQLAHGLL